MTRLDTKTNPDTTIVSTIATVTGSGRFAGAGPTDQPAADEPGPELAGSTFSTGARPVRALTLASRPAWPALTGSGIGLPANHSRDGESHSISVATATSDDMKPPATRPVTKMGTARADSTTRACRLPCSTCQPRATAATAHRAATIATTCETWMTDSTEGLKPPGTSLMTRSSDSRVSSDRSRATRSKAASTTKTAASITMTPAMVVWRGRAAVVVLTRSFHHRGG